MPSPRTRNSSLRRRQTTLASIVLIAFAAPAAFSGPLGSAPASAQASAPTLDALLEGFRTMPGLSARFTEEKRIALLARPLRSEGELYFAAPGSLLRRVTSPTPSAALIQGDTLVFESEGRRQEIPLSTNAVVGGFVAAFRYVLAGDRAALERTFELGHEALPGGRWRLTLRPRTEALRSFLTELKLEGSGQSVETMVMTEASSDVTTTTFREVRLDRRFSARERRRLFRL